MAISREQAQEEMKRERGKTAALHFDFLSPKFLEAMNDIGRYGHEKYGAESFHARAILGDTSRSLERTQSAVIQEHAAAHFQMHIDGTPHDHFHTRIHQLAAVAFNAMMESHFAGLETDDSEPMQAKPLPREGGSEVFCRNTYPSANSSITLPCQFLYGHPGECGPRISGK